MEFGSTVDVRMLDGTGAWGSKSCNGVLQFYAILGWLESEPEALVQRRAGESMDV